MQPVVPDSILRTLQAFQSAHPNRIGRYPRNIRNAVSAWAISQKDRHNTKALALALGISWDTLEAWVRTEKDGRTTTQRVDPPYDTEPREFIPVRLPGSNRDGRTDETVVEIDVLGGRRVRLRWPSGAAVLTEVIAILESLPC